MKEKLLPVFKFIKGKKRILIYGVFAFLVVILGYIVFGTLTVQESDPTEMKDTEGNVYQIKNIDGDFWMAENLKFGGHTEGNSVCYNNKDENCEKVGRLYDWDAAMVACPDGWGLPTKDDWIALEVSRERLSFETGGHSWNSKFYEMGEFGMWWLATSEDHGAAWNIKFYPDSEEFEKGTFSPDHYFSVLCIKN